MKIFNGVNKKISFPIAIIIIVVCAVLTGLIVWRYGLIPEFELPFWRGSLESKYCKQDSDCIFSDNSLEYQGVCKRDCFNKDANLPKCTPSSFQEYAELPNCGCVNNQCVPKTEEVTIATDKTEYEQGEVIKITVKNGLDVSIFYSGGERFWFIEKFEQEEWKNLGYEREGAFQLPVLEEGKEVCYIRAYERPDLLELKSNSEISLVWNQKICSLYREEEQLFEPELIKAGRYRFGFVYGLSKSFEAPYELVNPKIIYSNEFRIKENIGDNPIIHCGGGSCKCMKEKECEPYGGVYIIPTGEEECSANSDNKMCCCPGV